MKLKPLFMKVGDALKYSFTDTKTIHTNECPACVLGIPQSDPMVPVTLISDDGRIHQCNMRESLYEKIKLLAARERLLQQLRNLEVFKREYRLLKNGDIIQATDEAYTWADEYCTHLDWIVMGDDHNVGETYYSDETGGFVKMRRRIN